MGYGLAALGRLIEDPGPCPVCDAESGECTHRFYGDEHYRIGDSAEKHPVLGRRYIPAPHQIVVAGQVRFRKGGLMTDDEAIEHGVTIPGQAGPPRKKGRRQRPAETQGPKGPTEDRAHHPEENREQA
jgi:hypothetical protein